MLQMYLPMFVIFLLSGGIAAAMFFLGQWVGRKTPTPEKLMAFECGNDTEGSRGVRPSVKFYLTAVLFVVFDIEVVFMYPWAIRLAELGAIGLFTMGSFIIALLFTLAYCWKKGALRWDA